MFPSVVKAELSAGGHLELRPLVQAQEAGHLAGLEEVELVVACGRRGPVALHALQLAALHHLYVQLDVLGLVLIEQHLTVQEVDSWSLHCKEARLFAVLDSTAHVQLFILHPSLYHTLPSNFLIGLLGNLKMRSHFPSISILLSFGSPISFHSLAQQQLSLLKNKLNNGLSLRIHLFQSFLQCFEGLGQVPSLSPSPHC